MADRVLVWHIVDRVNKKTRSGEAYRLDADYQPQLAHAIVAIAPTGAKVVFDILADGVSIMNPVLEIDVGNTIGRRHDFTTAANRLTRGTIITMNVTQEDSYSKAADCTVALELRRL